MKLTLQKISNIILTIASAGLLYSCGNVAVEVEEAYSSIEGADKAQHSGSESYNFTDFNAIESNGAVSLILTQDSAFRIEVKGDKNRTRQLRIKQNGSLIVIDDDTDWLDKIDGGKCEVYISLPSLQSIDLSGASSTKTTNTFKQNDKLNLDLSGAGSIKLNLEAPELSIDASGATSITLAGKVTELHVDMAGAGSVDALALETERAKVESSGAGSVSVCSNQSLKVDASGVGAVRYKGSPVIEKHISGMASVSKVD